MSLRDFKPYPKYKDSGVKWLGEIPEHWKLDRLKHSIASCKNGIWGDEAKDDEDDIPCVRVADFDRQQLRVVLHEPTMRSLTQKERVGRVLSKGDLLLEKSGGGENQPVGCVVLYDDDRPAVCSNFVARIQIAANMDSSYWRYVHAAAYAIKLTTCSINQTSGIQNLDQDRYFVECAAFPPLEEQQTIALFLDRETSRIDSLISEKERLISLLQEYRQALISHAVTKGLDPNVKMKDSGVEWLGEVPEHWDVVQLRRIAKNVETGRTPSSIMPCIDPEGISWFTPGDFKESLILVESLRKVLPEAIQHDEAKIFPSNAVLIVSIGATLGKVGYLKTQASANQQINVVITNEKMNGYYLAYSLSDKSENMKFLANSSTIGIMNQEKTKEIWLTCPPIAEQLAIFSFLDRETSRIDTLISEARKFIDLLKEYRSSLITAAVTGKIDVREVVPSGSEKREIAYE